MALDEDFYWYIFFYEYNENPTDAKPNKNDKKYLKYSELLLEALEYGLGYRVEWEDTLYLIPTPLVKLDNQNRYHSETEPAIRWKGGKEFYFIHGVKVDEKIVKHPELLTKEDWLNEKNTEVRRVMMDKMTDFVEKIGGEKLQEDLAGQLWRVELSNDPENFALYVRLKDSSTDRIYFERVPPNIKTCREGIAWQFDLPERDYKPVLEA